MEQKTNLKFCFKMGKTATESLEMLRSVYGTFVQSIVTGDETWCFAYDPHTKRQSMEWRGPSSPKSRKFRFEKSKVKTMLITFFDAQGIIHKEFVPEGQTVNGEFYRHVMKRLLARIRRVRPHLAASGKWFLLHDNARPHTAICVRRFLAQQQVTELLHPPYSPDLAPADFFLFPRLKLALKGNRFSSISDIQAAVTKELKTVSKGDFFKSFKDMYERCQKCIVAGGNYFEGQ